MAYDPSRVSVISVTKSKIPAIITAIIPAFNEAKMIGGVLEVLSQVGCLERIIVVDDGSTDATSDVVYNMAQRDGRMTLIRHPKNLGKGQAVFTGWNMTTNPYLLLLDADLVALTPQHIYDLVSPVLHDKADMTLGLFREGHWRTDLSHKLTPWLSGQRCLRTGLYSDISLRAAAGYGLETAMTVAAQQNGWRCQHIIWKGVSHPPSETHRGLFRGLWTRTRMYANIIVAWVLAGGLKGIGRPESSRKRVEE